MTSLFSVEYSSDYSSACTVIPNPVHPNLRQTNENFPQTNLHNVFPIYGYLVQPKTLLTTSESGFPWTELHFRYYFLTFLRRATAAVLHCHVQSIIHRLARTFLLYMFYVPFVPASNYMSCSFPCHILNWIIFVMSLSISVHDRCIAHMNPSYILNLAYPNIFLGTVTFC